MTMMTNYAALCRTLVAAAALATAATAGAQDYEALGNLKASDLVPAALLKGPFHTVDENVAIAGVEPDFTIRSQ